MYQMRRGLGAATDRTVTVNGHSITVSKDGDWVMPFKCNFIPWPTSDCKEPSAVDLARANDLSILGPAFDPAALPALEAQWMDTEAAQCARFPETCAIARSDTPELAAVAASVRQVAAPMVALAEGIATNWMPVLVLGGAGLLLFVALSRGRR